MKKSLAIAILILVTASFASAALISVNFNGFTGGNPGPAQDGNLLEGPAGGLETTWNQYADEDSTGVMVDSTGAPTTVTFTTNFSEGRYDGTGAPLTMLRATLTDFARGLDNKDVTIAGLTAGGLYDVWLVSFRNQSPDAERIVGWWSTANTTTSARDQLVDTRGATLNNTTFVAGNNYALFENVEADGSGQIVFSGVAGTLLDGSDNAYRHGLNGFQIAQVPEPSALALVGLGIVAILLRRKFK